MTVELLAKLGADVYGLLLGVAVLWLGPRALRVLGELAGALREHSAALRGATNASAETLGRIEAKVDKILAMGRGPEEERACRR